ncbi:MAG: YybH family protein [Planctomycetaceae bacterium]
MRMILIVSGAALLVGVVCFAGEDKKGDPKPVKKAATQAVDPDGTKGTASRNLKLIKGVVAKPAEDTPDDQPLTEEISADEEAIRQSDESFAKAYGEGDAKSLAAHFTADAEYVNELGDVFQGRDAIEESMTEFFTENPGCALEVNIDSIRFITPDVAVEDGSTIITRSNDSEPIESRYTAVHVKSDGKWLAASVRDHAPKDRRQHRAQLDQLSWLQGDWVDEGDDSLVTFSCQKVDNGNFMLRTFTIHVAGQEAMYGTQRIGWDPLTGKLRAWIFDSEGGYAEGLWHRDEENWVLKVTGVTADGQIASSTSIYTFVNEHTMTWQSVDHEIAGVQQPDSEIYTIVRQAPVPVIADDNK